LSKGGALGGDGGFVEVSGKGNLEFDGFVDVSSSIGEVGTILLDPINVSIETNTLFNFLNQNSQLNDNKILFGDTVFLANTFKIRASKINTLNGDVIIQARDNITQLANANIISNNITKLVMQAGNNITLGGTINIPNGSIHLEANSPHSTNQSGNGQLTIDQNITTNGATAAQGTISLLGAGIQIANTAVLNSGAGNISVVFLGDKTVTAGFFTRFRTTNKLTFGRGITAGDNGNFIGNQSFLTPNNITIVTTLGVPVVVLANVASEILLQANNNIRISESLTLNQPLTIQANLAQNNNIATLYNGVPQGSFVVDMNKNIDTNNNNIKFIGKDFILLGNNDINAGAGELSIQELGGGGITLGDNQIANTMNISKNELRSITAALLKVESEGNVLRVSNVTAVDTQNITKVILDATKFIGIGNQDVVFVGSASTFQDLDVISERDIINAGGGSLVSTASANLQATRNITLDGNATNFNTVKITAQNATISDINAISFDDSTVTQDLTINAGGNITDSGTLTITGISTFTAVGNNVTLDEAASTFGPLRLTGNDVSVIENAAMDLGASNIGNDLTVQARMGDITNSGALTVGRNSIFRADANGADITLNNRLNDFTGIVTFLPTGGVLGGVGLNNVEVVDTTAFDIGQLNLTGALNVTSGGAITDSGTLAITGISAFNAGVNNITLNEQLSTFGTLRLIGNDVSVIENAAMDLGASNIVNDLTVQARIGDITNSGALTVGRNSIFRADANPADIRINNPGNSFVGTVTFQGNNLRDVEVFDTTAFELMPLVLGGNLDVTGAGITDAGGLLQITGTATFNAVGNDITLDEVASTFGPLRLIGQNVQVRENAPMDLGLSVIGNNLTVRANLGNITNSGALTVGRNSIFRADANGADIILNHPGNDFTGRVTIEGINLQNVTVFDTTDTDIEFLNPIGNDLRIETEGSLIAQGALVVGGNSLFIANAGESITLNNIFNDFTGTVTFQGTGGNLQDVTVFDTTDFDIGALTLLGDLRVESNGTVTSSGALDIDGTSRFRTTGADISLTQLGNAFTGRVTIEGNNLQNVTVFDTTDTDIEFLNDIGVDLRIESGGSLTVTGPVVVGGASIFKADENNADIILTNAGNNFTGTVDFQGQDLRDVSVVDTTDFDIGALTLLGNLRVESDGTVTSSGALDIDGTSRFRTTGADISLTQIGNDFTGRMTIEGINLQNVTVFDTTDTDIEFLNDIGVDLRIESGGSLTVTGPVVVGGNSIFKADENDADIILEDPGNNFTGTVDFQGQDLRDVSVVDITDFDIEI